jgi:hypothetical protein
LFFYFNDAIAKVYLSPGAFVEQIIQLSESPLHFENKTLWLNKSIQSEIKHILDRPYSKLRLRYKQSLSANTPTTIWFLDEIGKERPISFAIAVRNQQIIQIKVLEFRESRGYEIHIPAFSQQFDNIGVNDEGKLNKSIDGITGATMSVNAMKKVSRVALLLHELVVNE